MVVALAIGTGVVLGLYTARLHDHFGFSAYDAGIHLHAIWKLSRLDGLFNTVRGMSYWGDHLWLAYALLAPLYRVWTSPTLAYLYQGLGLGLGGIAVYGLGARWLQSRLLAFTAALLYWAYPGLILSGQENLHPEVLASTWMLVVLWADAAGRRTVYWLAVALALLTKEDVALYLLGIAACTFVRGERRRAVVLAAVSVTYFVVAIRVLLPFFNDVGFFRMQHGYWFSGLGADPWNPDFYRARLDNPDVRTFAWDVLAPVAFLPLLHPVMLLLLAGPAFVVNALGGGYLLSVHYHYLYGILPGVFAATLQALRTLEELGGLWIADRRLRSAATATLALVLLLPVIWRQTRDDTGAYWKMARTVRAGPPMGDKGRTLDGLIATIPAGSTVAASHNLVPKLASRSAIFMFPNPWHAALWGIDGENLPPPDGVQVLLLDFDVENDEATRLARDITAEGWEVRVDRDAIFYAVRLPRDSSGTERRAPAGGSG